MLYENYKPEIHYGLFHITEDGLVKPYKETRLFGEFESQQECFNNIKSSKDFTGEGCVILPVVRWVAQ